MTTKGQLALIKRHPSLTRDQFSAYWLKHAATVLPWVLANGCVSYVQIHNPRLTAAATSSTPPSLDMDDWDGAGELVFEPPRPGLEESTKSKAFYREVVVPDEKRFLVDEARKHAQFVEADVVEGDKVVIVQDGKVAVGKDGRPVVDFTEATRIWDEFAVGDEKE